VVATGLALVAALASGTAAPLAIGVGLMALGLTGWTLTTGAIPPLLIASILLFAEFTGLIVFEAAPRLAVPMAAAGLYLVVELAVRSLELRGIHPGWRSFAAADALAVAATALVVGLMAALVAAVATRSGPEGIFYDAVGIAAAAAVIGVIWLLVRRDGIDGRS
jgi:hypothetical protein